jgi:hypothetical protein
MMTPGNRILAPAVLGAILCWALPASAAPIGRPVSSEHQWRLGGILAAENVDVEQEAVNLEGEQHSFIYLAEATYGLSQDAEFFLRAGGSREKFEAGAVSIALGNQFDWGFGIRGVMYNSWTNWKLIGDMQYLARPGRGFLSADVDITEYQIAAAVETRIGDFLPYGGLFYDKLQVKSNNQTIFRTVESKNNIGVYLGTGLEPNETWSLFIETRLMNGHSFSGGAYYRF